MCSSIRTHAPYYTLYEEGRFFLSPRFRGVRGSRRFKIIKTVTDMNFLVLRERMQRLLRFLLDIRTPIWAFFICIAAIYPEVCVHKGYNNFLIFRASSGHLLHHMPLYVLYPKEYFDYFFYHPTFALLFMPFYWIPLLPGVLIWLLLSGWLFIKAVRSLPLSDTMKAGLLWVMLPEHIYNLQHIQTNMMMIVLILFTAQSFEKQRYLLAALLTTLCFCIKGYGGIVALLFLCYPGKWRYLLYLAGWMGVFTLLPLVVASPVELIGIYKDWFAAVSGSVILEQASVMNIIYLIYPSSYVYPVVMGAAFALILPLMFLLLKRSAYLTVEQRYTWLAYLLIWVVVFNRAAESPTYFVAFTGVALWYMFGAHSKAEKALFYCVFILMYILPSDLMPPFIKNVFYGFYAHLALKVFCCMPVLLYIQWQLIRDHRNTDSIHAGYSLR